MSPAQVGLVVLLSFIRIAFCQGVSTITVSKNPVYNGESLTLTCTHAIGDAIVVSVTMDAVNETRNVGTLVCIPATGEAFQNTGAGLFAGYRFTGCETDSVKSPSVSISASPSWVLDYTCTFKILYTTPLVVQNVTSSSTRLTVWVLPTSDPSTESLYPSLYPSLLVFNETDDLAFGCNSSHGTPAAAIEFVVVQQNRQNIQQVHGVASVLLRLPGPTKDWHAAEVTCRVENHNFPNMTARGMIRVNHITALGDSTQTVNTYSSSQPLNCSAHITSFPGATYRWSIPLNANISESASLYSPVLTLQQGALGSFNCTATNNFTGKAVVIAFNVISEKPGIWEIVVTVTVIIIVSVIVVPVVLWIFRRYFSKVLTSLTRDDRSSTNCTNNRSRDEGNDRQDMRDNDLPSKSRPSYRESGRGKDDDGVVKESLLRDGLSAQPTDDAECSEHSRLKTQLNISGRRLLIAAEGVVANLKNKTLPTTVLVTYPDSSGTLGSILVTVGEACALPAPPSFRSVALLLRRHKVGLSLSEVDQAVLTSGSVTGERGDKLRDFFTRLASMSVNKRAGDTRIDILNYGSTDAAQLAKALEDLLKVSVTVSSDPFGLGETNSLHVSNRSAVGEDYFNRRMLDEVVYADVGVSLGQRHSQPTKKDDQVLYSENSTDCVKVVTLCCWC